MRKSMDKNTVHLDTKTLNYVADYLEEEYFRANESAGCGDGFWENLSDHLRAAVMAYNGGASDGETDVEKLLRRGFWGKGD